MRILAHWTHARLRVAASRLVQGLVLGLLAGSAAAASPMVFQHLGLDDGLSQSTVMATFQDSRGLIWIATESGLNRYDGYDVTVYSREPGNANALSSDYIWAIDEDANGDIWFATDGGGVSVWSHETDRFRTYSHESNDENSLSSDSIRNLLVGDDGIVWIATRNAGLNRLDPVSDAVTRFSADPQDPNSISSNELFALLMDRDGNLWVGTSDGLNRWSPRSQVFTHFDLGDELRGRNILALAEDSAGDIWAGTFEGGLAQLNPVQNRVTVYVHDADDDRSLSNNDVRSIHEDRDARLWIGTADGLNLLDRHDSSFSRYFADSSNPHSLSDDFVMSLAEDNNGLLWIGTRFGGVDRWNPRSWSFGHKNPDWLDGAHVTSFADDIQGNIWVGTIGAGLSRISHGTGLRETLDEIVGEGASLPDERVMSLVTDRAGNLWIGTLSGGLSRLTEQGDLVSYAFDADDPRSISADGIMSLFEDRVGRIWIGTFGGGISLYDAATDSFERFPATGDETSPLRGARATAIGEDKFGNLWVGTDGAGLILLNSKRGVVRQYLHDASTALSPSSNTIYSIHIDDNNAVWLGMAGGGLNLVLGDAKQPDEITFKHYGRDYEINDVVYGVRADDAGDLWLSTNRGLVKFDPQAESAKTFHKTHGLQDEEFNFGAHHRTADGRLLFGGSHGFNELYPHDVQQSKAPPAVVLTELDVLNKPIASAGFVSEIRSLELAYNDDVVSFGFAALDYSDPSLNRYAYRLLGFDEDFIRSGDNRKVTYTNLDAGDYVFQVKAATADNVWSDIALEIPVKVHAAPWRTWWAYAAYVLAALGILILVVWQQRVRLERERVTARNLAKEVELRTAELKKRNSELVEASQAKSSFLARMSHEIRTPMNGVIGMTELIRSTDLTERQADYITTISHSAESLLQIINDILDLSKIESGQFSLNEHEFDLNEVVEDVCVLLAASAAKKDIEFFGFVDPDVSQLLVGDSARLRQILINLAGNAIKFTDAGEVTINARIAARRGDGRTVRIEVADTGTGIASTKLDYVFDAFAQADESTTQRFGGTGLGLSICRHLVSMMGGEIGVTSTPNIGSTFWCEIPFSVSDNRPRTVSPRLDGRTVLVATPIRSLARAIDRQVRFCGGDTTIVSSSAELTAAMKNGTGVACTVLVDADAIGGERAKPLIEQLQAAKVRSIFMSRKPETVEEFTVGGGHHAHVIRKPIRWNALMDAICATCGPSREPTDISPLLARQRRPRVLVIEDNMVNQLVAEGMLTEIGCDVTVASDGRRGIAKATTENYDLILMDAQMPNMDGYEATRLIRDWERGDSRTPIVGLSASASDEIGAACKSAGMDDFLSKPYVLDVLQNVVERWTATPSRQRDVGTPGSDANTPADAVELDGGALESIRRLQSEERPDVVARVLETFLRGSERLVNDLGEGRRKRCLSTLRASAHALKSSSSSVGALEFARAASQLEDACKADEANRALDLSAQLETMYTSVSNAVTAELRKELS